jgi:integrase
VVVASVNRDAKGWRVLYVHPDGSRKTLRLSGLSKAKAEAIGRHVDELCKAKGSGQPIDRQTSLWLSDIGQTLHDKLSAAGLVERRSSAILKEFMAEYLADARTADGKPAAANTLKKWRQAQKVLNEFFGNRNLRDITHDDAVKFRRWLDRKPLGENGKRTHIACAKMFLNAAKRRKLVDANPFEFQKASLVLNRSRDYFLSRADAMKIIDVCPDTQWKLIFALWRFAGLRKMEIFHLRWEHIRWDQGRMLVTCQKTAHHEGKGSRFVPIGDILCWLEKAFEEAPEGSARVITRFTESNVNLAKPLEKIIEAAGLIVWPKLIQNLRASCETEWLDQGNPAHVVARWIGHSVKVQNDNYAQVDDHHFEQFNARAVARETEAKCATEENACLVAHQVAHKTREVGRQEKPIKTKNPEKANVFRGSSQPLGCVRSPRVPEAGVEPAHGVTHTGF